MKNATQRKPDFFIVGAQRCGTTSLSQYLGAHPQIFLSSPKEPFYFSTDFPKMRHYRNDAEYLEIFKNCGPEFLVCGEATAGYLYSKVAIENIHQFNPEARIVVMLRHPVEIAYSFHSLQLFNTGETESDFEKAWALQEERSKGNLLPKGCRTPQWLQYRELGLLGDQMERLLNTFPREQIHILFFEDFIARMRESYLGVLEFLGVPDDGRESFPKLNENKQARFKWFNRLISHRPRWVQMSINRAKSVMGPTLQKKFQSLYAVPSARPKLDPELRARLTVEFRDDIEKLATLTGRNLDHWIGDVAKASRDEDDGAQPDSLKP